MEASVDGSPSTGVWLGFESGTSFSVAFPLSLELLDLWASLTLHLKCLAPLLPLPLEFSDS